MYQPLILSDALPAGFLTCPPERISSLIPGPTLFRLGDGGRAPVFISTLQHGNELTSIAAVQALLQREHARPHRDILLYVGNPRASASGRRHLADQPDYNRIWRDHDGPERALAAAVIREVERAQPFVCVDVHNTTGANPHYGCIASLSPESLSLAVMFSRHVIYFRMPSNTQTHRMAELAPSVTIECGRSLEPAGILRATDFLQSLLHLDALPPAPERGRDVDILETVGRLTVHPELTFTFGRNASGEAWFPADSDRLNFSQVRSGDVLAHAMPPWGLRLTDGSGQDLAPAYLLRSDAGEITAAQDFVPVLLTQDMQVIADDCLGYVMRALAFAPRP